MYYTVRDIMDIFHISKNTAYKLVHSVGAPTIRVGRKLLVDKNQFESWLKSVKKIGLFTGLSCGLWIGLCK